MIVMVLVVLTSLIEAHTESKSAYKPAQPRGAGGMSLLKKGNYSNSEIVR